MVGQVEPAKSGQFNWPNFYFTFIRDRSKKTLGETLKFDMKCMDLNEDMTKDRNTWKSTIHVADPT